MKRDALKNFPERPFYAVTVVLARQDQKPEKTKIEETLSTIKDLST